MWATCSSLCSSCYIMFKGTTNIVYVIFETIRENTFRTFIFSLSIVGGKATPVHVWLMGVAFCAFNGYMQTAYHGVYVRYPEILFWQDTTVYVGKLSTLHLIYRQLLIHIVSGIFLFFLGMFINIHSDHVLRNLRKPGETGYKIPRGVFFVLLMNGCCVQLDL